MGLASLLHWTFAAGTPVVSLLSVAMAGLLKGTQAPRAASPSGTLSGAPAVSCDLLACGALASVALLRLLLPWQPPGRLSLVVQPGPGFQEAQLPGNMVAAFPLLESLKRWSPAVALGPRVRLWLFLQT